MTHWLTSLLLLPYALVVNAQVAAGETAAPHELPPLYLAVPAFRPEAEMLRRWQPVADYLSNQIPSRRVVLQALSLDELNRQVRERQVDIVLTQPAAYVALSIEQDLYSPLATLVESHHGRELTSFGGVIFTRADNTEITTLADVEGKTIATSIKDSFGGYLMQAYELLSIGIEPDEYQIVEMGQQQDAVLDAVMSSKADVGFVRSGLLEELASSGAITLTEFRVLKADNLPDYPLLLSTRLYPEWALAAMPWVDPVVARQVATAMLSLPHDGDTAKAANISGFTIPGDYRSVERLLRAMRAPPFDKRIPLQVIWDDHKLFAISSLGVVAAVVLWFVILLWRAHQRRQQADEQLRQSASVYQHANEGILITDSDGIILDINQAFTRITGYERDDVLGRTPRLLSSGRQGPEFFAAMWAALTKTGHWSGEIWNRRKSGEIFPELLTISAIYNEKGMVERYVALFADITQIKAHQQQLEHIAHYDALTGLPNRVLLADRMQQAMAQALRRQNQVAVVYLDLDGFKAINDSFGHEVGDRLLVQLAKQIRDELRDGDTLSRLGGDEFVAVLPDLESRDASLPILERLLQAAAKPVVLDGLIHTVTSSVGVTFFPQLDVMEPDQLLRQADQAMYQAKLSGKNRYHFFDTEHDQAVRGHHEMLERIERALMREEFVLHYQPKVNMRSGEVIGVEALIRWQDPERGLLPPSMFLSAIENHQLSIALGEWVLQRALAQLATWRSAGCILPISINVDAMQLQQPDFVTRLQQELSRYPELQPGELELEILETSALEDITWICQVIDACRELGVSFAIDDFGTGYSSLTYLKRLPVTTLKIDQVFVRDMLDDADDLAILDGVIGLAGSFQRHAIAEGVETEMHSEMLLRLGCELGQGYAIARPMPAEAIPDWLASWRQHAQKQQSAVISREELPLLCSIVEYRSWVAELQRYLRKQQLAIPSFPQEECHFCRWSKRGGKERYGGHALFAAIEPLHEALHRQAFEVIEARERVDSETALARLATLETTRDRLQALLLQLVDEPRELPLLARKSC